MNTLEQNPSVAAARQSMNPQTNEENGNIMPDEEKMEEAFDLTASHNIHDPKDRKPVETDDDKLNENANNGKMDDEEVTDREAKPGDGENDNGRLGE